MMEDGINHLQIFADMDKHVLESIKAISTVRTFPRNTIIVNEGDNTDSLYIVLSGKACAMTIHEDGRQIVLNVVRQGDYFGELSFIDSDVRSATVMTKEPCKLLIIPRAGFEKIGSEHPSIILCFLMGLLRKLRKATQKIKELAFMDVYGRVARFLSDSVNEKGVIEDKLTHQEIAFMVGSSREMVSRVMKDLSDKGYVRKSQNGIRILNKLPYENP